MYNSLRGQFNLTLGGVVEWFKALVLKTSVSARVPWVRIPPPPLSLNLIFTIITPKREFVSSLIFIEFHKFDIVSFIRPEENSPLLVSSSIPTLLLTIDLK